MIRTLIAFLALTAAMVPRVKAQITSNVFERVLKIRVNGGTPHESAATAFTIDVDGREYLVTAKHVVNELKESDKIDIYADGKWLSLAVTLFRCDDPIDIAVLVPPRQLTTTYDFPFDQTHQQLGQDAYFLGFPFDLQAPGRNVNGLYPLALIKRATISGIIALDGRDQTDPLKAKWLLLDGYNNPGFSGGPIVYRDLRKPGLFYNLLGVVSGFRPDPTPVMNKHAIKSPSDASELAKSQPWRVQQASDGTFFEYVESGGFVSLNTGIVQGFSIEPAIDLIRQHPIGPQVRQTP